MNALRRVWNAFVSVAPMSEQRTFWPLWLIVGSTFGLTAAVPSVRFIAAFTFFAGCFLTLRYISFNGLGFQEFKRK